ncbi:CT194-like protein [Mya arenaria]|uniref:CT194-like protein n=1 Tax=Mya arenaria TaxID=6604 RepID=A0ABY7FJZ0_MYAAR|nr:CT194-like protein [Mya arenaria]
MLAASNGSRLRHVQSLLCDGSGEKKDAPEAILCIADVLLCIRCDRVDVYCNPVNYHYLLPYYEDEEKAEEFKISTFVAMVYGVEEVGGGGFFTMQHDIVDVSSQVHTLYSLMDPVGLETLILEQVTKLERQWQTMLSTMEPLRSFFIHGRANVEPKENQSQAPSFPYVLFGSNSRSQSLKQAISQLSKPSGDFSTTANERCTGVVLDE